MNDISNELKVKWISRALEQIGFEEMPAPGIFARQNNENKILVDLNEKQPSAIFIVGTERVVKDDDNNTLDTINQIIVDAESGVMPGDNEQVGIPEQPEESINQETAQYIKNTESLSDDDPAKVTAEMVNTPHESTPPKRKLPPPPEAVELTIDIVKKYINEKVTDEEAFKFIQLCKARQLNPFLGQVHLIKKEFTGTAKMVVGKDGFAERAARHQQYDGFEAGIIIQKKDKIAHDVPGAFHDDDDKLVGGWAKVYRKDQKHHTEARVSMNEYNTGMASWKKMPATMIRKVALVQALREAFPSELSGMYDQSEMGVEVST